MVRERYVSSAGVDAELARLRSASSPAQAPASVAGQMTAASVVDGQSMWLGAQKHVSCVHRLHVARAPRPAPSRAGRLRDKELAQVVLEPRASEQEQLPSG